MSDLVALSIDELAELLALAEEAGAREARVALGSGSLAERVANQVNMELSHERRVRLYEAKLRMR